MTYTEAESCVATFKEYDIPASVVTLSRDKAEGWGVRLDKVAAPGRKRYVRTLAEMEQMMRRLYPMAEY